ncbi:MAG TPA: GNAT family N-acetyltransferase [Thermomicrobiales bacterium]|nr:GNAT family N-acetyltransferase [Thermomicrobiales bacterium]
MTLTMWPFNVDTDLAGVADLIRAAPPNSRHLVDFPWRLSSPASQTQQDMVLWLGGQGVVGFAAWQIWWAALDFYVRPGPEQAAVEAAMFQWAPTRFRELDTERGHPLPYWAEAREDDAERLSLLARYGYLLDDDYAYIMLRRPLDAPVEAPAPPAGITIRPLAGADEVAAYVAAHRSAFASTSMTADWRARTLQMPQHRPALDLVAVTPGGELAGFCIGWLDDARRLAQVEPLGVVPAHQGQGIARALLLTMLQRFQQYGATHALVETESTRSPARQTYEAVGFRPAYQSIRKGQWFTAPPG